tara:strand:+ start:2636 stop:3490 length:855 start_codon:yes stop_codon:yes gene_type:complete
MKNSIDFITVVYKRFEFAQLIHESIKKYVNYPYTYYIVCNTNILDKDKDLDKLKKIFKDESNVVIISGVEQINADDGIYVPGKSGEKYSQQYYINNYGFNGKTKYDGRMLGFASWLQAKGMTIGVKQGEGKYICHVEHDCVFLNDWVDELLPLLKENVFVSYQWRHDIDQALTPQFSIMERETIENNYFREEDDLYPNCHYKDTYGLISLWARETNKPFYICKNSTEDKSLKSSHILDVHYGDEGFINGKPFIHHGGRGATRTDDYYNNWIDVVTKYLNLTIKV